MVREGGGGSRCYFINIYVERGWEGEGVVFFLQIHSKGLGGGVFGGRRRGKGVSFFRQTFFSLLNG
jgi:hypothetical protein